jgi:endoglucanase
MSNFSTNSFSKKLSFFICFFIFSYVNGQTPIYSEQFNTSNFGVNDKPNGYTLSKENEAFKIVGNGTSGLYTAFAYQFYSGSESNKITIDAAATPKLYIKARGTNFPKLRIDFEDKTGYITNLNASEVNLDATYKIYEIDYTGKLTDGAYGGPCTSGPCKVDASKLRALVFFVNAAAGKYNGTVEIDWLSIGSSLEELPKAALYTIRRNQVSYLRNQSKIVQLAGPTNYGAVAYSITDKSTGAVVQQGNTSIPTLWSPSREYLAKIDMTNVNKVGTYTIKTPEQTVEVKVTDSGWEAAALASMKYFYFNRAGIALDKAFAGEFERPIGHPDDKVIVHSSAATAQRPTGTIISSPKGWYDAGDYNKYIVNSGISTYTLLAAYEQYPTYFQKLKLNIPESSNQIADVLDEAKWNIDWMYTMQDPNDGGVYHKLTDLNFSGTVMPHTYSAQRYVVQKSTAATLNFAAVLAMAARIYKPIDAAYSESLLSAAKKGFTWAKANPAIYYRQPSDVQTGEYGDGNVSDEFIWAAAELFITTKDNTYLSNINNVNFGEGVPGWQYVSPLGAMSLLHHKNDVKDKMNLAPIETSFLNGAKIIRDNIQSSPMNISMSSNGDYYWGSNSRLANELMILCRAYANTNDKSYLNAAFINVDYLLGRNGSGYSYLTGFGDISPRNPHHRISEADNVNYPIPGMIVGGPNPGQEDRCAGYPNSYPASSFTDVYCSYASNEVAINWNAPVTYALNVLHNYQVQFTTPTKNIELSEKSWSVFPNPTSQMITLQHNGDINQDQVSYTIEDVSARLITSGKVTNEEINISMLDNGLYFIKIDGKHLVKFIKQ